MQFRSYTYDSSEIDVQYALDSRGNEIREMQLDEGYSGEDLVGKTLRGHMDWMDGAVEGIGGFIIRPSSIILLI